jgi:hypothetical protein
VIKPLMPQLQKRKPVRLARPPEDSARVPFQLGGKDVLVNEIGEEFERWHCIVLFSC